MENKESGKAMDTGATATMTNTEFASGIHETAKPEVSLTEIHHHLRVLTRARTTPHRLIREDR